MKAPILLTLGLMAATPSLIFAQAYPEPPVPVVAPVPQAPKAPKAAPAPAPAAPAAPVAAPVAVPAPPAPPRPMGQMINVRIDVTLADSKGPKKTLTMTVADGESGMNRTANVGPPTTPNYSFNADARPFVVGNRIKLQLTADATVPVDSEKGGQLGLRQSQTIILNDGDSVEIARAADPVSDRTFVLSVSVRIQR